MRIATYNVEWFSNLFDIEDNLIADDEVSGRQGVTRAEQLEALGIVFTALDADAIMIIEAPDTGSKRNSILALERFAQWAGLRARKALIGFANETQQEIALLFDPDTLCARHDPMGDPTGKKGLREAPRFDGVYRIDLDHDGQDEKIRFSKPPLEVAMQVRASGFRFRMIGVHVKSKAPHGAQDHKAIMRAAIANRRTQMAQCLWLRERVSGHLAAGEPMIVLGDFNDGPGLDEFEKLFGRSGPEIVMGSAKRGEIPLFDPHADRALHRGTNPPPTTSRFFLENEHRYLEVLLDYIMLSPDLVTRGAEWRIWHPLEDPLLYRIPELRQALLRGSDHFPVTVDLDI